MRSLSFHKINTKSLQRTYFVFLLSDANRSFLPTSLNSPPGANCQICLLLTKRYQSQKSVLFNIPNSTNFNIYNSRLITSNDRNQANTTANEDFNTQNKLQRKHAQQISKTIKDIYTARTVQEQFNAIIGKRNTNSLTSAKIYSFL